MVAKFYGMNYSAEMLRKHCHISRRGVNMLGIREGAQHIGFDTVGVKLSFEELVENGIFLCILHWNQNHFVVCYGIEKHKNDGYKIYISDPASQRLSYTRDEFSQCWIGPNADKRSCSVALMLEPGDNFGKIEDEYKKNKVAECNIQDIVQAFIISFKNMVGSSDDLPLEDNIFLSVLNVIQTTAGILITGIFGFILGNKIRNQ